MPLACSECGYVETEYEMPLPDDGDCPRCGGKGTMSDPEQVEPAGGSEEEEE